MAKMVMAAFATPQAADQALYELERCGYTPQEISVISKHNNYTTDRATGNDIPGSAAAGATTGGVIGGLAGLLAGVGVLPTLTGLFIGGPVAAALGLAGTAATTVSGAVTGAAAGGLIGALMGIGVPGETAESYNRVVSSGGVVLGLTGHEARIGTARAILEQSGAHDISEINARLDDRAHPADARSTTTPTATDGASYIPGRHEPAFGERPTPNSTRNLDEADDL